MRNPYQTFALCAAMLLVGLFTRSMFRKAAKASLKAAASARKLGRAKEAKLYEDKAFHDSKMGLVVSLFCLIMVLFVAVTYFFK